MTRRDAIGDGPGPAGLSADGTELAGEEEHETDREEGAEEPERVSGDAFGEQGVERGAAFGAVAHGERGEWAAHPVAPKMTTSTLTSTRDTPSHVPRMPEMPATSTATVDAAITVSMTVCTARTLASR